MVCMCTIHTLHIAQIRDIFIISSQLSMESQRKTIHAYKDIMHWNGMQYLLRLYSIINHSRLNFILYYIII